MYKRIIRIFHGLLAWNAFRIHNRISYKYVILVLANENRELDRWAIKHLKDFMKRKYVSKGMIIWANQDSEDIIKGEMIPDEVVIKRVSTSTIELFYDYYSFDKYFDNIVFTYTARPEENLLERVLTETEVNEEDAVCLALYHLRTIPPLTEE